MSAITIRWVSEVMVTTSVVIMSRAFISKNAPEILLREDGDMLFRRGVAVVASSGAKGLKFRSKGEKIPINRQD